jgi:hypothetical protein
MPLSSAPPCSLRMHHNRSISAAFAGIECAAPSWSVVMLTVPRVPGPNSQRRGYSASFAGVWIVGDANSMNTRDP